MDARAQTERTMLDRLNTRYGRTYRNGNHVGRRFSRAEHVSNRAGFHYGGERVADYVAIDVFMSQDAIRKEFGIPWREANGVIHGHEVKVSRSDWLTELRDTSKAEAWAQHCNFWWLVAPKDVVRDDLPEGWGLMIPHGKALRIAVQATFRIPEPMPTTMIASLARAITKTETRLALEGGGS